MNYLNIFLNPRKAVKEGYEKPNLLLGAVFVLSPWILFVLILLFYGFELDFASIAFNLIKSILFWAVTGAVLFFLLMVLKGKNAEFNLNGVLFGLSFIQLASIALVLAGFFIVNILSPTFFSELAAINNTALTAEQAMEGIQGISFIEDSFMLVAMLMLASLIFLLYMLYMTYLIISVPRKDWIAKNIIILMLYLGISGIILLFSPI
ncbi:MAG: hypothetical protein ABIA76_02955 [Candidatus Diapherotrites archaeon]